MSMQAIVDLYRMGVLGDKHGLPSPSQMVSSQQPSTPAPEIRSVTDLGDHPDSTSRVMVVFHEGDSRLPTKRRI